MGMVRNSCLLTHMRVFACGCYGCVFSPRTACFHEYVEQGTSTNVPAESHTDARHHNTPRRAYHQTKEGTFEGLAGPGNPVDLFGVWHL